MITMLKCCYGLAHKFLVNIDKTVGDVVKLETNPRNATIRLYDIESVPNESVPKDMVYIYCESKKGEEK